MGRGRERLRVVVMGQLAGRRNNSTLLSELDNAVMRGRGDREDGREIEERGLNGKSPKGSKSGGARVLQLP